MRGFYREKEQESRLRGRNGVVEKIVESAQRACRSFASERHQDCFSMVKRSAYLYVKYAS